MQNKKNIFWWWRRKRRIPISLSSQKTSNEIKNNEKQIIQGKKEEIITSPTPDENKQITKNKNDLINNERDTLIKPTKPVAKEKLKANEKEEVRIKKLKDKDKDVKNKYGIDEKTNDNVKIKNDTLDEIEKMLRSNYHELQSIKYELEILEEKENDEVKTEEVEKLIFQLEQLIKRFEKIKSAFYKSNFEEMYLHYNDDNYISQLIEEYKTSFSNSDTNKSTLLQVKEIEEYITLINEIIEIETKKDDLGNALQDKKEKFDIRDDEFEELKDKYLDLEKINKSIESFNSEYDTIIKNIETKVNEAVNVTKKAEYKTELVINYARLLTSTLLLGIGAQIPFTRRGNILKMGLMMASIAGIASSFRTRQKETNVTIRKSFIDYEKDILSNMNNINDMSLMLDKTMIDINDIRKEFQKEFSEYVNEIPEYYELMKNLDSIEKELLSKQEFIKNQDKKLEQLLEQNNVKVKRLEDEASE